MQRLLREGLEAGGLGFSSSWGRVHNDGDGRPVPSRSATTEELVALAGECAHVEGTSLEFIPALGEKFDRLAFNNFLLDQGLLPPDLLGKAVRERFIPAAREE